MSDLIEITNKLIAFRDDREWEQFHNSKNLALAISIEAAELNELFLWTKEGEETSVNSERVGEEIADILSYTFLLAEKHSLDIKEIMNRKIKINSEKYPISKSKGSSKKYNEL